MVREKNIKMSFFEKEAHFHVYKHLIESQDLAVKFLSLWTLNNLFPFPKNFKIDIQKIKESIKILEKKNFSYLMFDGKEIAQKSIFYLKKEFKTF